MPLSLKLKLGESIFSQWGRDSSVGIATRYWLDGPGIESRWGARFSAPVQTGPGAHPASCTMGTGSFPGVKWPGRGAGHPLPFKCRGHERVQLYLYSPSGPQWPVVGPVVQPVNFITRCVLQSEKTREQEHLLLKKFFISSPWPEEIVKILLGLIGFFANRGNISYFLCLKFKTPDISSLASAKSLLNHEINDEVNMHTINSPLHKF